jgi:hypothetical protein
MNQEARRPISPSAASIQNEYPPSYFPHPRLMIDSSGEQAAFGRYLQKVDFMVQSWAALREVML